MPTSDSDFDVVVVGAGPGGSAVAGYLSALGVRVLLVDRAGCPREKACGDAIGRKTLQHLRTLDAYEDALGGRCSAFSGVVFSSPRGHRLRLGRPPDSDAGEPLGYVVPRATLDRALLDAARAKVEASDGEVRLRTRVLGALWRHSNGAEDPGPGSGDIRRAVGIQVRSETGQTAVVRSRLVVGAAGDSCPIARQLVCQTYSERLVEPPHSSVAYREYWRDVEDCSSGDLEIHFLGNSIPGYFWAFPAGQGIVNVGLGMRCDHIARQRLRPRAMLQRIIQEDPVLRAKFHRATRLDGSGLGGLLPMGAPRRDGRLEPRRAYGNGVLLVGDAASLVNPFTGEGVGNALLSAAVAAKTIAKALQGGGLLALEMGRAYQLAVWTELACEMKRARILQGLIAREQLLNTILAAAARTPTLAWMLATAWEMTWPARRAQVPEATARAQATTKPDASAES